MENWKKIEDAKAVSAEYFVSDLGRIRVEHKGSVTYKTGYQGQNVPEPQERYQDG